MNGSTQILCWCAVQVTVFAAAALLVGSLVARRRPAVAASLSLDAFIIVVGLTLSAACPWPRWDIVDRLSATRGDSDATARAETGVASAKPEEAVAAAARGRGGLASAESTSPHVSKRTDANGAKQSAAPAVAAHRPLVDGHSDPAKGAAAGNAAPAVSSAADRPSKVEPAGGPTGPPAAAFPWVTAAVALYASGAGLVLLRILAGLISVRSYRRASAPIADLEFRDLTRRLCAEMGCAQHIELRQSADLTTAATVGWRKPVILLPPVWREWTPAERRAVLAHELAHVRRGDFLSWIVAQVGLALHFYHPLVHWMAARMRLEQELAADVAAAAVMSREGDYLAVLAAMALRQSPPVIPWPARAFLPTPTTLLRRIEMLRCSKRLIVEVPRRLRVLSAAFIVVAAVFAAGFRAPRAVAVDRPAAAADVRSPADGDGSRGRPAGRQAFRRSAIVSPGTPSTRVQVTTNDENLPGHPPAANQKRVNQSIDLAFVPRDALIVAAIRPANVLKQVTDPRLAAALMHSPLARFVPVPLARIEQVTALALPATKEAEINDGIRRKLPSGLHARVDGDRVSFAAAELGGFIIRLADPSDRKSLSSMLEEQGEKVEYADRTYFKTGGMAALLVGDRTIVMAREEPFLRRMIVAGAGGPGKAVWATRFVDLVKAPDQFVAGDRNALADWDALVLVNAASLRQVNYQLACGGMVLNLAQMLPDFAGADLEIVTARFGEQLDFVGSVTLSRINGGVADASALWQDFVVSRRRDFSRYRDELSRQADAGSAAKLMAVDAADSALDLVRVQQTDNCVNLTVVMDKNDVARFAPVLAWAGEPAEGASDEAKAQKTKNNLKRLALAMHNYHDVHQHFPPAVVMGPDGKTPHSWRVELLPFLEGASLFEGYRMNEPWDSPANKRVLEKMPDVFRSPYDDPKSTNSGYFALVGPGTAFEGTKGIRISDFVDGTSNTLLVVEAKRSIPWTKPEDIPFDPGKALPELGGFDEGKFAAALADGSVRLFETAKIADRLKWLIMRNDVRPVQIP